MQDAQFRDYVIVETYTHSFFNVIIQFVGKSSLTFLILEFCESVWHFNTLKIFL